MNVSDAQPLQAEPAAFPDADATQRVIVSAESTPASNPQQPAAPAEKLEKTQHTSFRLTTAKKRKKNTKKKRSISRRDKITIITLVSITVLLIIAMAVTMSILLAEPEDDGLILKGVIAAGVNIGGMTPEQAKTALADATANTYTELDMTITVLDSTITLSPKNTGARLDIESVVEDAFNYGRTGTRAERQQAKNHALANSYIVPITSYLNLDTKYIRNAINELGSRFSSTLTQPSLTVTGTRPEMGVPTPDTEVVHQTMSIYVGTAEYGLDTQKLYNKVMEYYNINIFQVIGECTVVAPESIEEDLLEQYELLCVAPVDAQIDPVTYDITPETYGYGFDLDAVKQMIASAPYGTTLEIPLSYIEPNLTEALLSSNLFKDTLSTFSSPLGIDVSWNNNVTLACLSLDGLILKSGEVFSFNEHLGELTADLGYTPAMVYVGTKPTEVVGGGVSQVASVLYNCVLQAGIEILEKHNHAYVTSFIEAGHDAYVHYGEADFRFRNSMPDPIRLDVKIVGNAIEIQIVGSEGRDYLIETEALTVKTKNPGQLLNYMLPNNTSGYQDGQVLVPGITGYDVEIYRYKYNKETGKLLEKELLLTAKYESRDAVVVKLQENATEPTEPSVPDSSDPTVSEPTASDPTVSDPTEPSASDPTVSDPTDPTVTEGSEPTVATEPPTEATDAPASDPTETPAA